MSIDLFEEKKDSIEKIEKSEPEINEKEKLVQYINYPSDLNLVSLKTRFACKKILDLLDNSKEEDLTWEDLNDPTKALINKEKLDRKIIQFYCMENIDKNKFASPSEKTMNKIQQFKRWQKYEMFKKNGVKNYLNNILPDYRIVHRTKDFVKNNLNLYTRLKIKKSPETIILPNLENQHYNNRNLKESEFLNNQSQSLLSSLDKGVYKQRLFHNKSTEDFRMNSSLISKITNKNLIKSKISTKKNSALCKSNQNISLINLLDNSKQSRKKNDKIKNFEDSVFCYNKVKEPLSVSKLVKSSPYGGCIVHSISLFRNKSMNDLLTNISGRKVLDKLNDYKSKRNKIINNKDYFNHVGKTFITNNKHLSNYDYNIF